MDKRVIHLCPVDKLRMFFFFEEVAAFFAQAAELPDSRHCYANMDTDNRWQRLEADQ